MKDYSKRALIWLMTLSLALPNFSIPVYAGEVQEAAILAETQEEKEEGIETLPGDGKTEGVETPSDLGEAESTENLESSVEEEAEAESEETSSGNEETESEEALSGNEGTESEEVLFGNEETEGEEALSGNEGTKSEEALSGNEGAEPVENTVRSAGNEITIMEAAGTEEQGEVLSSGSCGDKVTYTLYDSGLLVISGSGAMSDFGSTNQPWYESGDKIITVEIGEGVTSVGAYAFYTCRNLSSISLPEGVTSVGTCAFTGSSLSSISLPEGVTIIGDNAFRGCGSLSSITIPKSVTRIGDSAFLYCSSLSSINIPEGVESIGESAFESCSGLTGITIPGSVSSIGAYAFYDCSKLTSITIPASVTSIGAYAFAYCSSTLTIYGEEGSYTETYAEKNSLKFRLIGETAGSEEIPESGSCTYTFNADSGLLEISGNGAMPDYDSYGANAAPWSAHRSEITRVEIKTGVTSIGNNAFKSCSNLSSVSIPEGVTSIGESAFIDCSGLSSIIIPEGVTSIERSAFKRCSSLSSIGLSKGVTSIGDEAFYDCSGLNSISLPEGVTWIGRSAFSGCDGLSSISIPDSVTSIGENAFSRCSSLSSISLPKGVTSIGYYTFGLCSGLSSIIIPEGVTSIGHSAFSGCSSLTSITIPKSVTSMGDQAFMGCSSLTDIVIPEGVTSIGYSAFSGCSSLTSITIPKSVTSMGDQAFMGCSGLTDIVIPEGVTSIGRYTFGDCSDLSSISIPDSVISIGDEAFYRCSSLSNISIPEGVTNIGDEAFSYCSSLSSIVIPGGVTSIGYRTFENCSSLTSIVISEGVASIGDEAFARCSSLTSIVILEGVTRIGVNAFQGCSSLASITIPKSVTSIGTNAFNSCSSDLVITGVKGSYAETYAKNKNIPFVAMEDTPKEDEPTVDDPTEDIPADEGDVPEGLWIAGIDEKGYTYTGKPIKPTVRVYEGKTLLTEKVDYTISYKNNTKANDASNTKTAPTITVTGKGNYSGKDTKTFVIQPKTISGNAVQAEDLVKAVTNKSQYPVPAVKDKETGRALKKGTDFTVEYPDSQTGAYQAVGTYRILIKGTGNHTGTKEISLTITDQKLMSQVTVKKISNEIYTGSVIQPEPVVKHGGQTLTKGTDYEVTYRNNTEPGTATVILTGKGSYVGTKEVSFTILGTTITKAKVTGLPAKVTYTGAAIQAGSGEWTTKPVLTITLNGQQLTLTENTDYTVSYKKNVDKGKAEILFTGINGYSGTLKKTFTIAAYDLKADQKGQVKVSLPETISYEKGGSKPKPVVTFGGKTLAEGKDYTLSYKNNKAVTAGSNPSKAPVILIKGKGNFMGTLEQNFTIQPKSLQDLELIAADKVAKNKANAHTTTVKITDVNSKALSKGTDFEKEISYSYKADTILADGTTVRKAGEIIGAGDILPAGTTVVATVTGKGNYTGTLSGEYRMVQYDIGKARVTINPKAYDYTGKPIEPGMDKLTVTYQGKTLGAEAYKIIGYTNNTKKGTATVTIEGIGEYGGTKSVKFTIKAKGFLWWTKPSTEQ